MSVTIRQYADVDVNVFKEISFGKHPNVYIGTGAYIGPGVKFICKDIYIGDYTKINEGTIVVGEKDFTIGHNCYVGRGCILDTRGGLTIGNGVGIGAGSQLWTHIKFGDMLQGCMWNKEKEMTIEDDVWFVGHCLVSPIYAQKRSMALLGSVITKNMEENHVYAGIPAKSINQDQFNIGWTDYSRWKVQEEMFLEYEIQTLNFVPDCATDFNPVTRTYIKRNTLAQHHFMKWAVPLYKYNPIEEGYNK